MTARPTRSTVGGRAYLDLQNLARRTGRLTDELQQIYALECFLDRLADSPYAQQFVLKGGVLLAAYDARRPTRDVDLQGRWVSNDVDQIRQLVCEVAGREVSSSAFTVRSSTTPFTGPTTRCWSTATPTVSPLHMLRCFTCAGSPEVTWSPRTWRVSNASGKTPVRCWSEVRMARRIDYFDDPEAPAANSIVPSANVVVVNDVGEVLLIHRTDNDNWALPGGAMDYGESLPEAAVRETLEETGVCVQITGLVGIYTDPRHVIHYTSNNEVRQEFSVVFTAKPLNGEPTPSDESRQVRWVSPQQAGSLTMDRSMRIRLADYLAGHEQPHLG